MVMFQLPVLLVSFHWNLYNITFMFSIKYDNIFLTKMLTDKVMIIRLNLNT